MKKKKYNLGKDYFKKYIGLVLVAVLFVVVAIYLQIEPPEPELKLEKEMSAKMVELANRTGMSSEGKYLFYSSNPQIVGRDVYIDHCYEGKHVSSGLTRGCVASSSLFGIGYFLTTTIYLREKENPDYADAIYDTAAHEMLHVAYKNLSSREKTKINKLLDQELMRYRDDPRISLYTDDSGELLIISYEEFHSVLGSYYRELSEELEDHYKKYFSDRDALLKIGEASLYRSLLDEAALYRYQTEIHQKRMSEIDAKLYSSTEEIDSAERAKLEAQSREANSLFIDAFLKHSEVIELLE